MESDVRVKRKEAGSTLEDLDRLLREMSAGDVNRLGTIFSWWQQYHRHAPVGIMDLILTRRCNLRCDYCFVKKGASSMSWEVAQQAVDFLMLWSKGLPRVDIIFFGGEPLLEFGLMQRIAEYAVRSAQAHSKRVGFSVTTNGTLLSQKALEFAQAYGFLYLLSLDGDVSTHDRHRRTATGKGSFAIIVDKIPLLKRFQQWVGVRVTVMPDTVKRLFENIRYLFDLGVNQFEIGIVYESPWTADQLGEFCEQYHRLAEFYLEAKKRGLPVKISEFDEDLAALRRNASIWGCGAGKGRVAVTPDGYLFPCSRFADMESQPLCSPIGHVQHGFVETALLAYLSDGRREVRTPCVACEYTDFCTGGCPAVNLHTTGSAYKVPIAYCTHVKARVSVLRKCFCGAEEYPMSVER